MPTLFDIALALPWLAAAALNPVLLRRRPRLAKHAPLPAAESPLVSIIVPARNEANNIAECLGTLLASTYRRREIIVVDDRSTDGTTQIARTVAAERPDVVRVIDGQPLPPGWVGKCWACWQGFRSARGELLVFTDADTRHEPKLLGHAVGAAVRTGADLVTLLPHQIMITFWERMILPHVFTAIMLRYRDLERMNRSRNPRNVIANGQFVLFRRDAYEAVGGHEAVRAEIVEDLHLAQRIVAGGRRIYAAYADDLIATRMYRSLGQIVEGWSKNLASASRDTVPPPLRAALPWLAGMFLIAYWIAPPAALVLGLSSTWGNVGWSMTASAGALAFWAIIYHRLRVPRWFAALFPLGALAVAALFFRSAALGKRVSWKGRTYHAHADSGGPDRASP